MNTLIRLTANFIIAIGVVVVISGFIIIFKLGNLLTSIPLLNSFITALNGNADWLPMIAGGKVILDGLIYMAVGEFLILFIDLVGYLRRIAEK
jgi:hypothetical protein